MSRVADRVGAGSFGGVRTPRSDRGRAKAQAEGSIPEYDLQRLQLDLVAPCPMNPRRNYGTDDQMAALGLSLAKKQTTACVAVTREAYLNLWPSHTELIEPATEHVLLNGERRYRSARHVGLDALDFVVRDDLATSQADFIDYLMIENEDREDFDLIERARGLRQLLDACDGNAAEVARRRGKDRSWVGNQIALLSLPWPIQERLASGELAERYGRRLARALKDNQNLSVDDLLALAETLKDEERARRDQDRALREQAKAMLSADNTTGSGSAAPTVSGTPAAGRPDDRSEVLSADNTSSAERGPGTASNERSTAQVASDAVLSADSTEDVATFAVNGQSADGALEGPMLSADNIGQDRVAGLPHQGTRPENDGPSAAELVRALGATPAEQAATLYEGLDSEAFTALLEALYARV